ncbi:MAG: universal stress protein [Pseudodesulfovibrio sp.]
MTLFSALKKVVDKHYDAQAAANCNTCHVGTWVVSHEHHLMERSGGNTMKALFKRISGNRSETASDTSASQAAPRADRPQYKILVVCKGCAFSRGVVDYAVNIAKKTRSSLVALNIDESGRDFAGFNDEAKRNIEYFSCKAAGAELAFSHEIQQGDENSVVARMHEKDPQFRYVMNDTAAAGKSRGSIPVYTRATLHAK